MRGNQKSKVKSQKSKVKSQKSKVKNKNPTDESGGLKERNWSYSRFGNKRSPIADQAKIQFVTADPTRAIADNASKGLWSFVIGSLLGLADSLAGASTGVRKPHVHRVN
jgi:hypothetical protein